MFLKLHSDNLSPNKHKKDFYEIPNVVGMIEAFPVQINWPLGAAQWLFYRRDRGFHFLNFHALVDNQGYFQFVQGGYLRHSTDAGSFARLPNMGFRQQFHIPRNMEDMSHVIPN